MIETDTRIGILEGVDSDAVDMKNRGAVSPISPQPLPDGVSFSFNSDKAKAKVPLKPLRPPARTGRIR